MRHILIALCVLFAACEREAAAPPAEVADPEIAAEPAQNAEALYQENCGSCHNGGVYKAPHRMFLAMMAPDAILASMDDGMMVEQSAYCRAQCGSRDCCAAAPGM
jgi:mono/diheme cytochrome c family protein